MNLRTPICELFDIEVPVFLAGMGGVAYAEVCAAVSEAGGFGTLDEVVEILTWNQIGIIMKPVAFLDVGGYYDALFRFFDDAVGAGLIKVEHRAMAHRASTIDDAIAIATGPAPPSPGKWTDPSVR